MRGNKSEERIIKVQQVISWNAKLFSQVFNLLDFCKFYALCFKKFSVSKIKERLVCDEPKDYYNSNKRMHKTLLTLRLLMSYIYGAPILDVSRSHTQRRSTVGRTPLDE